MLFIDDSMQQKGYGRQMIQHWESEMKRIGFGMVMTSTQTDETAQHFYRKMGYKDCGGLLMEISGYEQPMELLFCKKV